MGIRARALSDRLGRVDPARTDALIALALAIEIQLQVWLNAGVHNRPPAAIAGVLMAGAVAVRRRWALAAVLVAFAAVIAQAALGGRLTQHSIGALAAGMLLLYSAGACLAERRAWLAFALGILGLCAEAAITGGGYSDLLFTTVFLVALPWGVGRMLRARRSRERGHQETAERLDAEREQRAQAAALDERARIARELHDVIAHSVSVMVIQTAAARMVMEGDPERAAASLESVERAGRDALAEMRRLLGVLDGGHDPRALAPQPGVADIKELIERTRLAGLETVLLVEGDAAAMSPALALCAYRIVQEALTNAIKHAGPARVAVRVRWCDDALELEVSDNGHGARAVNGAAGGHGIVGMRERAALHGGSVEVGPVLQGSGFAVRAHLPLAPEAVV